MAIRNTARTPNYQTTTTSDWSAPTFSECVEGYWKNHPDASRPDDEINSVDEAPADVRKWIASLSLLGNGQAETFDDLLFFPVVNPDSMALNKNALVAVVSGRGSQADISDDQLTSARKKAYSLLVSEFDYSEDDVPSDYKSFKVSGIFAEYAESIKEV